MGELPGKLREKLEKRKEDDALRELPVDNDLIDFSSNDYLGLGRSKEIYHRASEILEECNLVFNGAGGSRLLTGNHDLYAMAEKPLAEFHNSETALIFNSGYDANMGFFSSVPQRGDLIFYDELIHASIRHGITTCHARSYRFKHNDSEDLKRKVEMFFDMKPRDGAEVYVVTESVFSMDGDSPDLQAFATICKMHDLRLVVDEAHATGVIGYMGRGLVQYQSAEHDVFARLVTFGKAIGCHGAAILCDNSLRQYLINFARPFIYTTALPPHTVATIIAAYEYLASAEEEQGKLQANITHFKSLCREKGLKDYFIESDSAIHCCLIKGNENVKEVSRNLRDAGFDVLPILSPTVSEGSERLRFCLHSFNKQDEIEKVVELMSKFIL